MWDICGRIRARMDTEKSSKLFSGLATRAGQGSDFRKAALKTTGDYAAKRALRISGGVGRSKLGASERASREMPYDI